MRPKNNRPDRPEVIARIVERVSRMTPEEALAFLTYRTPGIEETDMTGMFSDHPGQEPIPLVKRRARSA